MKRFISLIKRIRENDPVYSCEIYKKEGCVHVDGMLCNMKTCKDR